MTAFRTFELKLPVDPPVVPPGFVLIKVDLIDLQWEQKTQAFRDVAQATERWAYEARSRYALQAVAESKDFHPETARGTIKLTAFWSTYRDGEDWEVWRDELGREFHLGGANEKRRPLPGR